MKAEQRAAVDGAFEPGRGGNAASWRGAGERAITREAAGAPSAAGGRCSNLSESARGKWLPLCRADYCWLSGSKAGQDKRENWSLLSGLQSAIRTQSEGLVYPSALTPPSDMCLSVWCIRRRGNHRRDSHSHRCHEGQRKAWRGNLWIWV